MFAQMTTPGRLTDLRRTVVQNAAGLLTRSADRLRDLGPDEQSVWRRRLALTQGGYYVLTGVWPFVDMRSFEAVTGPKKDHWLVQTVGALVGALGGALLVGGLRAGGPSNDLASAAAASAAALALLDGIFVAQRRIAPVYLLDAAVEGALVAGWVTTATEAPHGDGTAS